MEGWNKEKVSYLIDFLERLGEVQYELQNCYRGAKTGCETYVELADYLRDQAKEMEQLAYELENTEEDVEDDLWDKTGDEDFEESFHRDRTLREWTMRDGDVEWEDFDKFTNYKKYLPTFGEGDTLASQMATAVSTIVHRYFNDGDTIRRAPGWGYKRNMTGLVRWLKRYVPELRDILTDYPKNEGPMYKRFLYDLAEAMDEIIDDYADEPKAGTIYKE